MTETWFLPATALGAAGKLPARRGTLPHAQTRREARRELAERWLFITGAGLITSRDAPVIGLVNNGAEGVGRARRWKQAPVADVFFALLCRCAARPGWGLLVSREGPAPLHAPGTGPSPHTDKMAPSSPHTHPPRPYIASGEGREGGLTFVIGSPACPSQPHSHPARAAFWLAPLQARAPAANGQLAGAGRAGLAGAACACAVRGCGRWAGGARAAA